MPIRDNPYGAFRFLVKLGDEGRPEITVGGFSDVSGLGREVKYSEYRNGNEPVNHVRKIPNTNTSDDVTLKRGLIGDVSLFDWLNATSRGDFEPRTVLITLMDEAGTPACEWKLLSAQPKKWVGPTLGAKGGGEVAMEEIQFVTEQIDYLPR